MGKRLFIRGGALGDFVLTLPALEAIRADDPAGWVEVLGYPEIAALAVGHCRPADASRWVGDAAFAPLFSRDGGLGQAEAEYLAGFDAVVCVWPDASGVIRRNLERCALGRVAMIDPFPASGHAVDFVLAQMERAGYQASARAPKVVLDAESRRWAEGWLNGQRLRGPALLIHPGSGSPKKNWPAERFAEAGALWEGATGGGVAFVAGPADGGQVGKALEAWSGPPPPVLREASLLRVAAVLGQGAAYLGNDSGISHLAAAVGAPTLALFGPTDPRQWAPRGPRASVLENAMAAEPSDVANMMLDMAHT